MWTKRTPSYSVTVFNLRVSLNFEIFTPKMNNPDTKNISENFLNSKQAKDNVELGSPVVEDADASKLAPFPTSFINLLKTIIGSGILTLPLAVQRFGLIPGVTLMFIAAGTATFGLHILNVTAMQLGRKSSFSGICGITYPKAAFAFEMAIAIKCIGTSIAYLSALGGMAVGLGRICLSLIDDAAVPAGTMNYLITSKAAWVIFLTLCISPICFMKRMDSLKYTSYAGMVAVVYLVILTIFNCISTKKEDLVDLPLWKSFSLDMCKSYGTLIFAYTCHQNILPIQNEARNNTPRGMMNVIGLSMLTATSMYVVVSIFGAVTNKYEHSNILDSFPKDMIAFNIARVFYILLLLASYPLQVFPCRNSIEKMTLFYLRAERLPKETMAMLYIGSTVAIIGLTAFVATLPIKLDMALNIVGAVAGTFICYILPSVLFNKLYEGTPMNWRRVGSYMLLVFGFISFVMSSAGIVASLISSAKK
jgi:amino acid permease